MTTSKPCRLELAPAGEPTWRKALQEIATADPVDLMCDPQWPQRIARVALAAPAGEPSADTLNRIMAGIENYARHHPPADTEALGPAITGDGTGEALPPITEGLNPPMRSAPAARAEGWTPDEPFSPQGEAVVLHAVVLLARKFTEANDRGDLFGDELNDECLTDEERSSLDLASNQADEDYNTAKSALFALCRTLERDPKKSPAPDAAPAGEPQREVTPALQALFAELDDDLASDSGEGGFSGYSEATFRRMLAAAPAGEQPDEPLPKDAQIPSLEELRVLLSPDEPAPDDCDPTGVERTARKEAEAERAAAAPAGEPVAPNKLADDVPQDT